MILASIKPYYYYLIAEEKKENRSKKNGIEKLTAGYSLLYEQGRKIFCENTERVSREIS